MRLVFILALVAMITSQPPEKDLKSIQAKLSHVFYKYALTTGRISQEEYDAIKEELEKKKQ